MYLHQSTHHEYRSKSFSIRTIKNIPCLRRPKTQYPFWTTDLTEHPSQRSYKKKLKHAVNPCPSYFYTTHFQATNIKQQRASALAYKMQDYTIKVNVNCGMLFMYNSEIHSRTLTPRRREFHYLSFALQNVPLWAMEGNLFECKRSFVVIQMTFGVMFLCLVIYYSPLHEAVDIV